MITKFFASIISSPAPSTSRSVGERASTAGKSMDEKSYESGVIFISDARIGRHTGHRYLARADLALLRIFLQSGTGFYSGLRSSLLEANLERRRSFLCSFG